MHLLLILCRRKVMKMNFFSLGAYEEIQFIVCINYYILKLKKIVHLNSTIARSNFVFYFMSKYMFDLPSDALQFCTVCNWIIIVDPKYMIIKLSRILIIMVANILFLICWSRHLVMYVGDSCLLPIVDTLRVCVAKTSPWKLSSHTEPYSYIYLLILLVHLVSIYIYIHLLPFVWLSLLLLASSSSVITNCYYYYWYSSDQFLSDLSFLQVEYFLFVTPIIIPSYHMFYHTFLIIIPKNAKLCPLQFPLLCCFHKFLVIKFSDTNQFKTFFFPTLNALNFPLLYCFF